MTVRVATPLAQGRAGSAASSSSISSAQSGPVDRQASPTIEVAAYPVFADDHPNTTAGDNDDDDDDDDTDRPEGNASTPPPPPSSKPPPVQLPVTLDPPVPISVSRRITLTDLVAVATAQHSGVVKKQAKYRNKVWHDRFLLLHENVLFRFKNQRVRSLYELGAFFIMCLGSRDAANSLMPAFSIPGYAECSNVVVECEITLTAQW